MKKALILAGLMVVALTACGKKEEAAAPTPTAAPAKTEAVAPAKTEATATSAAQATSAAPATEEAKK